MPTFTITFPDKMLVKQNVGKDVDKLQFSTQYVFSSAIPGSFIRECALSELRRKYADELRKLPMTERRARSEGIRELDVYKKYVRRETSLDELLSETEGKLHSADVEERRAAKAKLERIQALLEKMEDAEDSEDSEA